MTRKELIRYGKDYLCDLTTACCEISDIHKEFVIEAIKALEQEPILDKVRTEIVELGQRTMNDNRASGIWACRDIIDKYRNGEQK